MIHMKLFWVPRLLRTGWVGIRETTRAVPTSSRVYERGCRAADRVHGMRCELVTVDVGNTLLHLSGGGAASAVLAELEAGPARDRIRHRLLTEPLTRAEVECLAGVPISIKRPVATLSADTSRALARLRSIVLVATLSNTASLDATLPDPLSDAFPDLWRFRSCETGHAKPDRRAFLEATEAAGVEPANTIHIGDSWSCDVVGADGAGIRSIWVGGSNALPADVPPSMIGNVTTFADAVDLLLTGDCVLA